MAVSRKPQVPRRAPAKPRVLGEQGERTRARLLDSARQVFKERSYTSTRVDDITNHAGTSHGAFYLYFSGKAEVLEALALQTAEDMYALADTFVDVSPGEDGFEKLRAWIEEFVDAYERHSPVLVAWMSARPEDERFDKLGRKVMAGFAGRIARAVDAAVEKGIRHPIDPGIAATALVAMLERLSYYWLVRGAKLDREAALETLAAIWHQAIFGQSHHD